jgi:antitoxin (DNA-binding transcriptional repressor) of toxin-antitoxin stability system
VEQAAEVVVCKRNVPVARFEPLKAKAKHMNRSKPGSMKGTVKILGDLTEPFISEEDWEMFK